MKLKLKEKWKMGLIIIAIIVGLLAAAKLLPFWVTILSVCTFLFGTICGWFMGKICTKYFPQQE